MVGTQDIPPTMNGHIIYFVLLKFEIKTSAKHVKRGKDIVELIRNEKG